MVVWTGPVVGRRGEGAFATRAGAGMALVVWTGSAVARQEEGGAFAAREVIEE